MSRRHNRAKALVVLIVFIAVMAAAVIGIITLIKSLTTGGAESPDSDPSLNTFSPIVSVLPDESDNNMESVEPEINRNMKINFRDDVLSITNIGQDFTYSYDTKDNVLFITVYERTTEDMGLKDTDKSRYFNGFEVSEEKNCICIVFRSDNDFNIIEEIIDDKLELTFTDLWNEDAITYRNDLDRHYMIIDGAALSMRSDSEIKFYTEIFDETNLTRTLTIDRKYMPDLVDEKIILNDGYLRYYEIKVADDSITMIFALSENLVLYPNTRDYNASISFIKDRSDEKLIVLDPGHGGIDGGAVSADGNIIEKDIVLLISSMLEENLEDMGYNVYNLRVEDVFLGLMERTDIANILGADSFISVHINSFTDPSINGTVTLYKTSAELASAIQDNLVAGIRSGNMGIARKLDLSILNRAEMEAVIVECGFVSNVLEAEKLKTSEYQTKIAKGIAAGINEFYENRGDTDE